MIHMRDEIKSLETWDKNVSIYKTSLLVFSQKSHLDKVVDGTETRRATSFTYYHKL